MGGTWARRIRTLIRILLSWSGAVVVVAVGGLLPLLLAGRVTYWAVSTALGSPHGDLSDIGFFLLALGVAAIVGLAAGVIGSIVACVPALALIGKSGVFDRLIARRARGAIEREDGWPFEP